MISFQYSGLVLSLFFITCFGCHPVSNPGGKTVLTSSTNQNNSFEQYWYKGEAELNTFRLEQSRYGEMRDGEAVMVFVTEDLSQSRHVKLDEPQKTEKDKVSVMKLNLIRRFITGIYDYSMMQSIFTPVDVANYPYALKTTTTSQDWCGHTFTQIDLQNSNYHISGFSYFEQEGDFKVKLPATLLEDNLWSLIRIDPASIPTGETEVIPSTFFSRLQHETLKPKKARIRFEKTETSANLILEYLHLNRSLTISFEPEFPYRILGWTEMNDDRIASKGFLKSSMKTAYWKKHGNEHVYLRDSLQMLLR
jgi:hypothetical protein